MLDNYVLTRHLCIAKEESLLESERRMLKQLLYGSHSSATFSIEI